MAKVTIRIKEHITAVLAGIIARDNPQDYRVAPSTKGAVYAIYYITVIDGERRASFVVSFDTFKKAEKRMEQLERRENAGEVTYLDDIVCLMPSDINNYQKAMDAYLAHEF